MQYDGLQNIARVIIYELVDSTLPTLPDDVLLSIFENGKGKFIRAREEGVFNENVVIIIIGSKFTIKIENVKYQQERAKSEL